MPQLQNSLDPPLVQSFYVFIVDIQFTLSVQKNKYNLLYREINIMLGRILIWL